jgi:hypothetical protein
MIGKARSIGRGDEDVLEVLGDERQDMLGPGTMVVLVVRRRLRQTLAHVAPHCLFHVASPPPYHLSPSLQRAYRHLLSLRNPFSRCSPIPLFPAPLHNHCGGPYEPQQKPRQKTECPLARCAPKPLHRHRPGLLDSSPHPAHGPVIATPADRPSTAMRTGRSPNTPPLPPKPSQVIFEGSKNAATSGLCVDNATLLGPGPNASGSRFFCRSSGQAK